MIKKLFNIKNWLLLFFFPVSAFILLLAILLRPIYLVRFGYLFTYRFGHNIKDLHKILSTNNLKKPKIIIADTTKGKGVSFMENNNMWHYKNPNIEQLNKAIKEINKKYA